MTRIRVRGPPGLTARLAGKHSRMVAIFPEIYSGRLASYFSPTGLDEATCSITASHSSMQWGVCHGNEASMVTSC